MVRLQIYIFIASVVLGACSHPVEPVNVYLGGRLAPIEDYPEKHRVRIFKARHAYYQSLLNASLDAGLDLYVARLAARDGRSVEEVEASLFKSAEATDTELKAYYDENRHKIPYPFDMIKEDLKEQYREDQREKEKIRVYLGLEKEGKLSLDLRPPTPPRLAFDASGFASVGEGPIEIVEFGDFQCPHCKELAPVLIEFVERYRSRIRFTFVDLPLLKGKSYVASQAAYCADRNGRFWDFYKQIYDSKTHIYFRTEETLAKLAGMEKEELTKCLATPQSHERYRNGQILADRFGISSTPFLLVNGRPLLTGHSLEAIKKAAGLL